MNNINLQESIKSLPYEVPVISTIPEEGFYYRETATSHEYYYNKKRLPGVTTILNSIAKPALLKWAVELAVEYLKGVFNKFKKLVKADFEEAAIQHTKKKDAAADIGTIVHNACEEFLKHGVLPNFTKDSIQDKCFNNFKTWWGNDKKLIHSEIKLYNVEYWYAGTCDIIYEQGGNIYIADIKTSNAKKDYKSGVYTLYDRTYHAQTAAYQYAYEKLTNEKVSGRIIVRIGKDGSFSTHESLAFEQDFLVFLAALAIYRFN